MVQIDKEIAGILPMHIVNGLNNLFIKRNCVIFEIRIRIGKPIIVYSSDGEDIINTDPDKEDMKNIMQRISNYSLYAYEEDIKQGFITIKGGHRVGIAGECVMDKGQVKTIRNISSVNIRIAREVIGCSDKLMNYIACDNRIFNTIIISPPKCGKTTILRDITRNISNGVYSINLTGRKVAVIDERSEIGACYFGVPQTNIGIRTDVLDNCMKKEGLIMAVRSLSPEVLVCDEIGTKGDVEALMAAFNSGVNIVTTIHGFTIDDLYKREVFKELLDNNVLERAVILSSKNGVGTVEKVYRLKGGEKFCLK